MHPRPSDSGMIENRCPECMPFEHENRLSFLYTVLAKNNQPIQYWHNQIPPKTDPSTKAPLEITRSNTSDSWPSFFSESSGPLQTSILRDSHAVSFALFLMGWTSFLELNLLLSRRNSSFVILLTQISQKVCLTAVEVVVVRLMKATKRMMLMLKSVVYVIAAWLSLCQLPLERDEVWWMP